MPDQTTISNWFQTLQDSICEALETEDGQATFQEDLWERPGGGGGRTRVIRDGAVFEKGGVNYSGVHGVLPERIRTALGVSSEAFFASGISIVIHPVNPHVPIIHMNTRYFEMEDGIYWFGGGIDLTPHYVVPEQAAYFHRQMKQVCDRYDADYYPRFKTWADDYFFLPHRSETRGIGGIFFDRLRDDAEHSKEQLFAFVQDVGKAFAPTYRHLVQQNKALPFTEQEKQWQLLRRGRYVEFNLVYDKGTQFGLQTSGRIESILMSLPKFASWEYDFQPEPGSREAETLKRLKKNVPWADQRG